MNTIRLKKNMRYDNKINDPINYDRSALEYLIESYGGDINKSINFLNNLDFTFLSMTVLHKDAIDIELIYRQAFPVAIVHSAFFPKKQEFSKILNVFLMCQTLILNHVDRHLDYSDSYTLKECEKHLGDIKCTMSYALCILYKGIVEATNSRNCNFFLHEMMSITEIIIQSMFDNYYDRYNPNSLHNFNELLKKYLDTPQSRHLGSGFYASSIHACFGYYNKDIPEKIRELTRLMRILRQRVDEIADIQEDISSGLVTYPIALLFRELNQSHRYELIGNIEKMWCYAVEKIKHKKHNTLLLKDFFKNDPRLTDYLNLLKSEMVTNNIYDILQSEIENIASLCHSLISDISKENSCVDFTDMHIIIDLKSAFLDRLKNQKWDDIEPQYTLVNLLKSIQGNSVEPN